MRKEIEAIVRSYSFSDAYNPMIDEIAALFERKLREAEEPMIKFLQSRVKESLSDHEKLRREHWSRLFVKFMELYGNQDINIEQITHKADHWMEAFDNKFNPPKN